MVLRAVVLAGTAVRQRHPASEVEAPLVGCAIVAHSEAACAHHARRQELFLKFELCACAPKRMPRRGAAAYGVAYLALAEARSTLLYQD